MPIDIFEFWSQVGPQDTHHPQDSEVLSRLKYGKKNAHGFDLRCLPFGFLGPLRNAPVVLLYLSPGFDIFDLKQARTSKGRDWVMECRTGNQRLPGQTDHPAGWKWWKTRTSDFGDWKELQDKVAVLNIGAYHSPRFSDWGFWPPFHQVALPSIGPRMSFSRMRLRGSASSSAFGLPNTGVSIPVQRAGNTARLYSHRLLSGLATCNTAACERKSVKR